MNDPQVRLLNPCKPEIGKISSQILKAVIKTIKDKSKLTQWKNTDEVIHWFKNLTNKKQKRFIQFDICSYYPSITPTLLEKSLDWACMYTEISQQQKKYNPAVKKIVPIYRE